MEKVEILQDTVCCLDGINASTFKKGDRPDVDKKGLKYLIELGACVDPSLSDKEGEIARTALLTKKAEKKLAYEKAHSVKKSHSDKELIKLRQEVIQDKASNVKRANELDDLEQNLTKITEGLEASKESLEADIIALGEERKDLEVDKQAFDSKSQRE